MVEKSNPAKPPFTLRQVNVVLVAVIVALAFLAGYFQALYKQEIRRYKWLENIYFDQQIRVEQLEATKSVVPSSDTSTR